MKLWRFIAPLAAVALSCNPSGDYAIYCQETHRCDAGSPDSGPPGVDAGRDAGPGADAGSDAGASEPTAFSIVGPLPNPLAGACAGPVTVQLLDQNGVAMTAPSDLPWTIVPSPPDMTIAADRTCASSLAPFSQGTSSASFFFESASTNTTYSLVAMLVDGGLPSAPQTTTIETQQLAFGAFPALTDGVCAKQLLIQTEDGNQNPISVPSALSVTLSASPTTLLYTDGNCSIPGSVITIAANTSSATFSLKACSSDVLGASANNYATTSQRLAPNPGPPATIQVNGGQGQSVPESTCSPSPVSFTVNDSCGNPTSADVLLDGGLTFFSSFDFTCGGAPITDIVVTGSDSFYFEGSTARSYLISLSASQASTTVSEAITDAGGTDGGSDGGSCSPDGMSCASGGAGACCQGGCACPGTGCNGFNNQTCCSPAGKSCGTTADCCFAGPATPSCNAGICCLPNGAAYCTGGACCGGDICEANGGPGQCCTPVGSSCDGGTLCCDGGTCQNGSCAGPACLPPGTWINPTQCGQCCNTACTGPKPCPDGGAGPCSQCG